jgi:hypothetical protein
MEKILERRIKNRIRDGCKEYEKELSEHPKVGNFKGKTGDNREGGNQLSNTIFQPMYSMLVPSHPAPKQPLVIIDTSVLFVLTSGKYLYTPLAETGI